jgi:hypothetical protein
MTLHEELRRVATAWPTAATAQVSRWAREKAAHTAQVQSRRLLAEAHAELLRRALVRFAELCYEGAPDDWYNVGATGRVLVPVPWSRTQHAAYGLSDPDSRILRAHVADVLAHLPARRAWLWYDARGKRWHINRGAFPTLADAQGWLAGPGALTATRYLSLASDLQRRGAR